MMKTKKIYLAIALLCSFGLTSCYKDLGHYDYSDLRDISIKFTPEKYTIGTTPSKRVIFTFDQPNEEKIVSINAVPLIAGQEDVSAENISAMWYNPEAPKDKKDTIFSFTKDFVLKAKAATDTTFILQLDDEKTELSYFYQINIKTTVPYINSWFVLHGMPGEMMIGNAERREGGKVTNIHKDISTELYSDNPFKNTLGFAYAPNGNDFRNDGEALVMYGSEGELYFSYPFDMKVKKDYSLMMPQDPKKPNIIKAGSEDMITIYMISNEHKLYLNSLFGNFYKIRGGAGAQDYHADEVVQFKNQIYIWDDTKKQVYYVVGYRPFMFGWSTSRNDNANRSIVAAFPGDLFPSSTYGEYTFLSFVPEVWNDKVNNLSILFKDKNGSILLNTISQAQDDKGKDDKDGKDKGKDKGKDDKDGKDKGKDKGKDDKGGSEDTYIVTSKKLNSIMINEPQEIALSDRFPSQIFYAVGNLVYAYDIDRDENRIVYTAPGNATINHIRFKSVDDYGEDWMKIYNEEYEFSLTLGISLNYPNQTGEVRELQLTTGGDVQQAFIYKGFGPIKDLTFTKSRIRH